MDVITVIGLLASLATLVTSVWMVAAWLLKKRQIRAFKVLLVFCGQDDVRPCGYRTVRRGIKRIKYAQYADNLKAHSYPEEDQGKWYYIYFSPRLVNMASVPIANCTVSVSTREQRGLRFDPVFDSRNLQLTPRQLYWFYPGVVRPGEDLVVELSGERGSSAPIRLLVLKDSGPRHVLRLEVTASFGEERTTTFRIRGEVVIELNWPERIAWILVPVTHLGKAALPMKELRLNRYYLLRLPRDEREKYTVLARLERLGPPRTSSARPHELVHYRLSPDGSKAIVQAIFAMEDLEVLRSLGATYLGAHLRDGIAEDSVYQELQRPEWNLPETTG
ncbi:hypothetical protein Desku_2329 [Desulfofundulus kuznetsovii DSM 6115]|uniref:DUF58 domain-containing protein n=1 Tax=Desulfofundulus kuznetsovii (strain DSM 6115 / VKM B-1805 / 17) TaxID=760568 RepID=A0AAU8PR91_DESK7|nr:hypothetical protein Desku_2329 [Desulfofundulus kuznetsovii DSM 6115]